MKTASFAKLAVSTLVIGATMTGGGLSSQAARAVSAPDQGLAMKQAAGFADQARAILIDAKAKKVKAVDRAEHAVALIPVNASYRMLLARAYLANGRFTAAETSFSDALALDPSNAKAALNLALMKIARGDNGAAIGLLEQYRSAIALPDYGLALALAGDLASSIESLQTAARAPGADAKSRQNLGLAYALAGRWQEARILASQDLSPDMVDDRMTQWAMLSRPSAAWDQVAGVIGVKPVNDPGQPQRLALIMSGERALAAVVAPEPVAPQSVASAVSAAEPVYEAVALVAAPEPVFETPPAAKTAAKAVAKTVVVALAEPAPQPVVVAQAAPTPQPVSPPPIIRSETRPIKQFVVLASTPRVAAKPHARAVESGKFVVQLGAYSQASRAETAWDKAANRVAELLNYRPSSARVQVNAASLYRLSVSGFVTRAAANQVCTRVKNAGGQCFVRSISGDTPMQFVSRGGGMKFAARR